MRKNLRASNAGSALRAMDVRRGAVSFKMGAFFSMAGVLSLALAQPANAQGVGGPATLASELTTTGSTQRLQLITTVTQIGPSQFQWTFQLSNPFGNTVFIRSFTAAPFCDLTGATNIQSPAGWTFERFAFSPQQDPTLENNKINWFVPVTPGVDQQQFQLKPGDPPKFFSFVLSRGADPTFRGKAGALDTFGFSGDTLGCPPPPPPPGGGGGQPGPGIPVRQHGPFYLAQAYPALVQTFAPATGISPNACFLNGTTQAPAAATTAVPGVLCLAKNLNANPPRINANAFATCNAAAGETLQAVQAVTLNKVVPGSFKCDAFGMPRVDPTTGATSPASTFFQDANNLRTWWTLRYTQPGTKFILDVVVVCRLPNGAPSFHIDRWVWIVVADVRTFPFVVDLLHQDAIGTFELPCIVAEDVVSTIRSIFSNFQTAVSQNNRNAIFNNLIDLEAYIALNCLLVEVAVPELIFPGAVGGQQGQTGQTGQTQGQFPGQTQGQFPGQFPVGGQIGGTYQPPGNQARMDTVFGTGRPIGILDTTENPCCCKLLADLEFIGQQLGISFGPHTFLNGRPI